MRELQRRRPRPDSGGFRQLARTGLKYGAVGALGVVVNSVTLAALYQGAHLPLFPSSVLAVETSIIGNYLLNDRWTFGRQRLSLRRFAKFNLATVAALAITPSLVSLLVVLGVNFMLANFVAITANAAINFTTSAFWVWRPLRGGALAWSPSSWDSSSSSPSH